MNMKRILLAALALAVLGFVIWKFAAVQPAEPAAPVASSTPAAEKITAVPPTCTEAGYTIYENPANGSTRIEDGDPALGHDFGQDAACVRCGIFAGPEADALPRLEFTGSMDGISKSDRITLGFTFNSADTDFSCYSFTTWQGHSTLAHDKKNYTIRLFADSAISEKYRLSFNGWQPEHKYVLKANYRDPSQARNLVAAGVWSDMAATRANLPARLTLTSNYGAVDGFPVSVWLNGEFHGLYTMNLHKDEDLYQLHDGRQEAIMIANAQTSDESLFRAPAAFSEDESDWELEYCATDENNAWAKESFNALIGFVMTSDDKTFRDRLSEYLDVDGAIDYLIYIYSLGLSDAGAKDLVMVKYEDTPWIPSVYDMEDAFGLSPDGAACLSAEAFLPEYADGTWSSSTGSLLWDRLLNAFAPQIRARYAALRQTVLSEEALTGRIRSYIAGIPEELYRQDAALYPDRNLPDVDCEDQMIQYTLERMPLLDTIFAEE